MNMVVIDLPDSPCEGWYTLHAHKVNNEGVIISSRKLAGPFKNIITDQGLDRMGANNGWMGSCQVGSGNATPTASDTSLQTYVAGVTGINSGNQGVQVSSSPYYAYRTNVYRFGTGVAAGNLSEVGVGWSSSGSTLYSRALIVDGGGTPITITVLSDEILDVTYQWRVYPPMSDITGTITISGSNYDYTIRAANANQYKSDIGPGWGTVLDTGSAAYLGNFGNQAYSGSIGSITGEPTGTFSGVTSSSSAAYGPGDLYRDGTHVYGLAVTFNIGAIRFGFGWNMYQIGFSPVIPKNNTNELTIVFRHSWSRATI